MVTDRPFPASFYVNLWFKIRWLFVFIIRFTRILSPLSIKLHSAVPLLTLFSLISCLCQLLTALIACITTFTADLHLISQRWILAHGLDLTPNIVSLDQCQWIFYLFVHIVFLIWQTFKGIPEIIYLNDWLTSANAFNRSLQSTSAFFVVDDDVSKRIFIFVSLATKPGQLKLPNVEWIVQHNWPGPKTLHLF